MKKIIQQSVALLVLIFVLVSILPVSVFAATAQFAKVEALEKALNEYQGDGVLSSLKLEHEGSDLIYSVQFRETNQSIDVRINAVTGETEDVVETEIDENSPVDESDLNSVIELIDTLIALFEERLN